MAVAPWYKVVTPRREVREGRSFSPDEFAIALEQVVAGTAPEDYSDPEQFFARTCFTRALTEHAGMALRRLAGETGNTAPVLTLITQFGGGKTHTLTALYHLARAGAKAADLPGVPELLHDARMGAAPKARVGVFVGNAWDPAEGRETPWIDISRQLAGDSGVAALGTAARTTPPGTEALGRVFAAANGPVLLLFDEVLNFVNRHRGMAESFHAFLQNLTVSVTGTTGAVAVISLPRSQVEMTEWDQEWQERITKIVRRVARDLIANDESEISEVVRRRLFEHLGGERIRSRIANNYANWCFERSARLPPEWLTVDSARRSSKAKEFLRSRFEACYPFHPATLSVFQRKWSALAQYQQTRGTLAMLAQWISWASRKQFAEARTEPLITLGSAPLDVPEFRAVVLGQLGESRLEAAIDADIAGAASHADALDADTRGSLRGIHRRVGAAVFFESSGGQVDKVAHLPELRFALGEPAVETTTIDNAATALEARGFFLRTVGTDGYRIHHQATLRKVVSDRQASLDPESEVKPAMQSLVETEFRAGAELPAVLFPADSAAVPDSPRLSIVVLDPGTGTEEGELHQRIRTWTRERGASPRLYPGSLVWCVKKSGRELESKVELWLAWKRVAREVADGILGPEYGRSERQRVQATVKEAHDAAKDEVWAGYRFVSLLDGRSKDLRTIDLGAGHASTSETLTGRVVRTLRTEALLSNSVGAGYIERHWPPALEADGAWPLTGLRQSFLDGSLTRLIDPDQVLRRQICDFVARGDFGLGSGRMDDGFHRLWYGEPVPLEEVTFEPDVYLVTGAKAEELRTVPDSPAAVPWPTEPPPDPEPPTGSEAPSDTDGGQAHLEPRKIALRIAGDVPPEVWNRLGTKLLPRLRQGSDLRVGLRCSVNLDAELAASAEADLRMILDDLGIGDRVIVERANSVVDPDC